MIQLCRHIKPEGTQCTASALRGARFCHMHERLHAPRPAGEATALSLSAVELLFPEDRVAIQTNLFRIADALAAGRIDLGTANSLTYNMRAALANLGQRPLLASSSRENDNAATIRIERVILTPEGDRIAPPREQLESGESEPVHHRKCPCLKCAEKYRNWSGELHHADCACGLCEPFEGAQLVATGPRELTATPLRRATAAALLPPATGRDPLSRPLSVADYTFGDSIRRHEAQYAARAAAALAAGIEPPPYQPFETGLIDPASEEAAVERDRQQQADQLWTAHFRSLLQQGLPTAAAAPESPENALESTPEAIPDKAPEPAPAEAQTAVKTVPQAESPTQPQPGRLSLLQANASSRFLRAKFAGPSPKLFLCAKQSDPHPTPALEACAPEAASEPLGNADRKPSPHERPHSVPSEGPTSQRCRSLRTRLVLLRRSADPCRTLTERRGGNGNGAGARLMAGGSASSPTEFSHHAPPPRASNSCWREIEDRGSREEVHSERESREPVETCTKPMKSKPLRSTAMLFTFAAILTAAPGYVALAQTDQGTINEQEADQIRQARNQPVERVKLYQKFLAERIDKIKEIGPNPTAETSRIELRARYEEFTRLANDLEGNLDTFDAAHADIRRPLKDLIAASEKWPGVIDQAGADPNTDSSRKIALSAANSILGKAKTLADSQKQYFSDHKDDSGKTGSN